MALRLPQNGISEWARELIDECFVSREQRRDQIRQWKAYYYTGTSEGTPAIYNRCYPHVDRLASMLFSPVDARFDIEFDETEDKDVHARGRSSSRYLNREFHRCGVDIHFASAVNWALVKGCAIVKNIWGHDGVEPWVVHPEFFGVLREDIADLERQEAFVHSTYLTRSAFRRTLVGHPEEDEILSAVEATAQSVSDSDMMDDDYFHQIIVGGLTPVSTSGQSSGQGVTSVFGVPQAHLDPKVAKDLIRVDELWVMDAERNDYTTVRMVADTVIEGGNRHQNLSGVEGETGFVKVCPNEVDGYFWGQSELAQIYRLQDMLNQQVDDIRRMLRLQADPPRAMIGFSGMTREKYRTVKAPGGYVAEDSPAAKVENLAGEIKKEFFEAIDRTLQMFDDVAGFTPILMGQGEQGVRSGVHASTIARNSSPRMRDRALLVERQLVEEGDFALKLLQNKNADEFRTDIGSSFLLKQLPDDARVTVDSHTASPAFSDDAERKADKLIRVGAIDAEAYIRLTHPPHEDSLAAAARAKAEAMAKLIAQHPELALGKGRAKR